MRRCWTRHAAVLALTVLAIASCRGPDADADLRDAVSTTFADAVTFEVEVVGDADAPIGVEVAGLLDGARITGARDATGEVAIAYDIGASAPLFEIRTAPERAPLLRMGLADLLGIADDADPETTVGPVLDARGVTGERRAALLAGFSGDWIELEDVQALGALASGGVPPGAGDEEATTEDAGDWRDAMRVTDVAGTDEARTYRVRVDVAALREALAVRLGSPLLGPQVPSDAAGSVTVVDGRVTDMVVELGAEDAVTDARLEVRFDGHGRATVPERPEPVARVSTGDLAALVGILESGA